MSEIRIWIQNNLKGDPVIWFLVIVLSAFSIMVVYSATGSLAYKHMQGDTEYYLFKHTGLVFLSLLAMWLVHRLDFRYYAKISRLLLWICVPLLLITWKFGVNINEASRWITIPVINQAFQPSDLAKLALLVTLASMLSKRQKNIDDFQHAIIPMIIWIAVICGLIAMTNVSTGVLLFLSCTVVLFIGRVPVRYLALLLFAGSITATLVLVIGQRGNTAMSRVESYIDGDISFQSRQSYVAVASGGVFGKGPGQSDQRNYLPHPYSDFIYAIIIEEYGLIGGITVLLMYLTLLYRGMKASFESDRAFGSLLSAGLIFALVIQAFINMGVAVGLGPVTGLPLPLISMGGTSQLFMGVSLGIILSISRCQQEEGGRSSMLNSTISHAA